MRVAIADPPYVGCAHLYPEQTEVDHGERSPKREVARISSAIAARFLA